MQTLNAISLAKKILLSKVNSARCIIDATAGNGKDTLFLAEQSPADAKIYAFDIQAKALEKTREKLCAQHLADKVQLVLDSHKNVLQYVTNPIEIAMFNLGYLPGTSHETMTLAQSTVEALAAIVKRLVVGGVISVIAYPGHSEGQIENEAVRTYVMTLCPKQCTVMRIDMINHTNNPPILYIIEKISE